MMICAPWSNLTSLAHGAYLYRSVFGSGIGNMAPKYLLTVVNDRRCWHIFNARKCTLGIGQGQHEISRLVVKMNTCRGPICAQVNYKQRPEYVDYERVKMLSRFGGG